MASAADENLAWIGSEREVRLANWSGAAKTMADWQALKETQRQSFVAKFKAMCLVGTLPHPYQIDDIGDGISEFKIDGWRFAAFREGRVWRLTHLFKKKHGDRWVRRQRTRACRARVEHQS